jgi:3'(2'), 5'-bisphosphate nucleotidase
MQLQLLLKLALQASNNACNEILEVYGSNDFQTEAKGDNSPLTLADRKAHKAIVSILQSSNLPILSEEGKSIPYEERKNWVYFWMVDPLDGTKEFIKRNSEFTVNIALIHNGVPVMGVVAVPVTGETFYGSKEGGAFLEVGGTVTKLEGRRQVDLTQAGLRVVASRSHMNDDTQHFIDALKNPTLVSSGSSLKFMLLVSGKADVYPRFAPTMEWDTAAAHAVVNAVGLKVLQQNSEEELVYNKPDLLNPYFLCR